MTRYNTSADIYSYAVMLLEILCCDDPKFVVLQFRAKKRTAAASGFRPEPTEIVALRQPDAWALVQDGWHSDPKRRPSAVELIARLEAIGAELATLEPTAELPGALKDSITEVEVRHLLAEILLGDDFKRKFLSNTGTGTFNFFNSTKNADKKAESFAQPMRRAKTGSGSGQGAAMAREIRASQPMPSSYE